MLNPTSTSGPPAGTYAYTATMEVMGQSLVFANTRTVESIDGGARLRVVDTTVLPPEAGAMVITDSTVLLADGRPVSRRLTAPTPMGTQIVRLDFTPTTITGSAGAEGALQPISVALDGPVYSGVGLEMMLATRTFAVGQSDTLAVFEPQGAMAVEPLVLSVDSVATITVPAGTFEAYALRLGPTNASRPPQQLWVSAAAPHVVLRAVTVLAAEMGGGTMTQELTSRN